MRIAKNIQPFQARLLAWYRDHARDLPWRKTRDPYKIWVSEIMLQQTQVQTVVPYYEKWMKRFPTLEVLANAPLSEVLRFWAGLGYYRRARMLHEAARLLCKNQAGKMPKTAEALRKVPGIGPYTAGAVASIAYGEKTPVLDGNVIRILTRLGALPQDIGQPKTIRQLWGLAESLVPEETPGDFNQAMMELGATVCLPRNPLCRICPVHSFCLAYEKENPEKYPVKKQKEKIKKIRTHALVWRRENKVLVKRQAVSERWGGLWMFPFWPEKRSLLKETGVKGSLLRHRLTVHHGFTKYHVRLDVYEYKASAHQSPITGHQLKAGRWVRLKELSKLAFPSPHQKIVRHLLKNHGKGPSA